MKEAESVGLISEGSWGETEGCCIEAGSVCQNYQKTWDETW